MGTIFLVMSGCVFIPYKEDSSPDILSYFDSVSFFKPYFFKHYKYTFVCFTLYAINNTNHIYIDDNSDFSGLVTSEVN